MIRCIAKQFKFTYLLLIKIHIALIKNYSAGSATFFSIHLVGPLANTKNLLLTLLECPDELFAHTKNNSILRKYTTFKSVYSRAIKSITSIVLSKLLI